MKPSKSSTNRVTYLVDMDFASRRVDLRVTHDLDDGTVRDYTQSYNLDILPFDAVMSQICGLLLPRNK